MKRKIIAVVFGLIVVGLVAMMSSIIETNEAGYFQVKQAIITGDLTTRIASGTYLQNFGDITTYKNVATVGIGTEQGEGSADIPAVSVIFNDGSKATISGFLRVRLPSTSVGAVQLKKEYAGDNNSAAI